MKLSGRRALVTGAGGFIGSHLTERLVELGVNTRALVHYNGEGRWGWLDSSPYKDDIEVVLGDVCDRDSLVRSVKDVDVVFHLAALIAIPYSYDSPASYIRTNVEGTLNLLQAARGSNVSKIVHTSTSEVYGSAQHVPIDEDHQLRGQSPYAASKIGADKVAEAFHLSFGVPIVTIRPFNTFGPRQSARAIIPTIVTQCLNSDKVLLGNLQPTRDFNFVMNTVNGFVLAGESTEGIGQTFNIGSGEEISIGQLAERIAKLVGRKVEVECQEERIRPMESEVDRLCADNKRAKEMLRWESTVSLNEGLKETIDWIRENLHHYKSEGYIV